MTRLHNDQERRDCTVGTDKNGTAIYIRSIGPRGIAVKTPAAWSTSELYIDVSDDSPDDPNGTPTNWYPLRDKDGNLVKLSAVQATSIQVFPAEAWPVGSFPWMRLRAQNTQSAARDFIVCLLG